jgi:hypothetical protein
LIDKEQIKICEQYDVTCQPCLPGMKVGVAVNVRDGIFPINGLRHPPEIDTTGWYIWAGEELSGDSDFFKPLHVEHLPEWCPEVLKFLGLPPGWRFLIAGDYEDVWYDESLLNI